MIFSQIKDITIPQGNVIEIKVGGQTIWKKSKQTFEIINNLSYITTDNNQSKISINEPYLAVLTPQKGYKISKVIVTMNNIDITSSVYAEGIINIPSVEGNIEITAVGIEKYTNWVFKSVDSNGAIYNYNEETNEGGFKDFVRVRSGGLEAEHDNCAVTGFIPVEVGDVIYIWPPFTGRNINNAINFYSDELDSNTGYVCLGQCVGSGDGYGIATNSIYHPIQQEDKTILTITSDMDPTIRFIRITNLIGHSSDGEQSLIESGREMIVTKNEEL